MYAKVPAINGVPKTGGLKIKFGMSISDTEAIVAVNGLGDGWIELTEAEFLALGGAIPAIQSSSEESERLANLEQVVDALLNGEIPPTGGA